MSDEEDTLGDFFAKKDKGKKPKKKKKLKSNESTDTQSEVTSKTQVDEWKDFAEEKEKDYSSLKIHDLQINGENIREEEPQELNEEEVDGNDCLEKEDNKSGIWNAPGAPPAAPPPQQSARPAEVLGVQNVVGGKYVPPAMKRSQIVTPTPQSRRGKGAPPDISSQAMFPTLGAANQDQGAPRATSGFEVVKRGTRTNDARLEDPRSNNLNLGNRFDGLRS